MGKIFAMPDGVYVANVERFSHLHEDRTAAIAAAFQGDYALSIAIFLRTFRAVPHVPAGLKSHESVLDEIQYAMIDSLQRNFEKTAHSLHDDVSLLMKDDVRDYVTSDFMSEVLLLHIREFEMHTNAALALGQIRLLVHNIRHGKNQISEANLLGMQSLVTET